MAGLVPAIHVFSCCETARTWMPGTRPGMTGERPMPEFIDLFSNQTPRRVRTRYSTVSDPRQQLNTRRKIWFTTYRTTLEGGNNEEKQSKPHFPSHTTFCSCQRGRRSRDRGR